MQSKDTRLAMLAENPEEPAPGAMDLDHGPFAAEEERA
jgi:hypothetical protein